MSTYHVSVSDVIPAPAEAVYGVIRDYHIGHAAILPQPFFESMTVLEGGIGAGTVVEVRMNVLGAKRVFTLTTAEPEPGRVLRETDDAGIVTTFTVDPVNGGGESRVTIETHAQTQAGFAGMMERLLNPPITRRIYRDELKQLADYVRVQT